jgi:hypothetical protein
VTFTTRDLITHTTPLGMSISFDEIICFIYIKSESQRDGDKYSFFQ